MQTKRKFRLFKRLFKDGFYRPPPKKERHHNGLTSLQLSANEGKARTAKAFGTARSRCVYLSIIDEILGMKRTDHFNPKLDRRSIPSRPRHQR